MSTSKYKRDLILATHFVLGVIAGHYPMMVFYWVIAAFLLGLAVIIAKQYSIRPYFFPGYLVGMELLGRMSGSGLPHEFTKYAVALILLVGVLFYSKEIPLVFLLFIFLLIPGMFFTVGKDFEEARQLISANLSGPFCLAISAMFFWNRGCSVLDLRTILVSILYPLAATLGYLVIQTPSFDDIEFGFQSNFAASVYGPNQMSSILGLGILLIGLGYLLKIRIFGSYLLTLAFFAMLVFRGLLTFSRGGMLTALILLTFVFAYLSWKSFGFNRNTIRIVAVALIVGGISSLAFSYTNVLTSNALFDRYVGIKNGKKVEDIDKLTSGRTVIVYLDWKIFLDNPLFGVGVGMGKFERPKYGYAMQVAAHNEFSRLVAEHGLFGMVGIGLMLIVPFRIFLKRRKVGERVLIIVFIGFSLVFMTHAATRIAAPCFLYGLAFIKIIPVYLSKNDLVFRKQTQQMGEVFVSH